MQPELVKPAPELRLWMLYPLFFAAVYLSHLTLLRLPYFWDEGGYYIPAALDLFRTGTLIPRTTLTNAHPPLPSILLAGWWHLSGFVVSGTRTLVCMVAAAALSGVFRLCRRLTGDAIAAAVTLLTAAYPVWYAQSTLAHADIFAAAFSLWAMAVYLPRVAGDARATEGRRDDAGKVRGGSAVAEQAGVTLLFSLAALAKETAIVTPVALALMEAIFYLRARRSAEGRRSAGWILSLLLPVLPLLAWYGYHYHVTGFVFGNPEFLRYNATANLSAYRIALCLWHRTLHLTMHMNMFVPVLCAVAALLTPPLVERAGARLERRTLIAIAVVLTSNLVAFSVLGGALLTRYLLPMYPLVLLLAAMEWRRHFRAWWAVAALSFAAFVTGIWVNPPYAFAPEDNLTYRDMIVVHQQAIRVLTSRFPSATVLTAWPATAELQRPDLGYTKTPLRTAEIRNFSREQIEEAAKDPGAFDTALIFSTKWAPAAGKTDLGKRNESEDTRFFDFHRDLSPGEAAALLGGEVVWAAQRKGEWAAVLHFPRTVNAELQRPSR